MKEGKRRKRKKLRKEESEKREGKFVRCLYSINEELYMKCTWSSIGNTSDRNRNLNFSQWMSYPQLIIVSFLDDFLNESGFQYDQVLKKVRLTRAIKDAALLHYEKRQEQNGPSS
ncbi:hypothetical protein RB195_014671 [Necator americanus]|uniref:Uncharacterized protein n=1 Tax=Necator americanus TaxID=51031 RepID=A0ABR1E119_NECAM